MPLGRRRLLIGGGAAVLLAACSAGRSAARDGAQPATSAPDLPSPGHAYGHSTPLATRSPASPVPRGPAVEISHGHGSSKQVALTFHVAGDPRVVSAVLRAARRANVRLTMLVVGEWLAQNPHYAETIVRAGHDLGNHTWSHPVLTSDDPAMTHLEVVRCRDLLTRLTGAPGRWFRPSGTPRASPLMLRVAGRAGYPTSLSYDVDPLDYTDPGAAAIVSRVVGAARGGSIVSLHTLYPGTAIALPHVIAGLRARGLEPVSASRLLPRAGQGQLA